MLVESKISQGVQQNADPRTRKKHLTSTTNPVLVNPQKKDVFFGQTPPPSSNKAEEKKKGIDKVKIFNTSANLFALAAYTILVGSAALSIKNKAPLYKEADKLVKFNKTGQSHINQIKEIANDQKKPWGLKLTEKFGELQENSEELTNNMVYAFGTLVVMPFVILFSPFGKKDASKEDRIFTIFRQPLSFLTTFGAQLTVDKLVKTAIPEMRKFGLLDNIKSNGKVLEFDDVKTKKAYSEKVKSLSERLGESGLANSKKKAVNYLKSELNTVETKMKDGNGLKFSLFEKPQLYARQLLLKQDLNKLEEYTKEQLEKDPFKKNTNIMEFVSDKVKTAVEGPEKVHYENIMDNAGLGELKEAAHETFVVQRRNLATKNMGQVFLNSTVSQAISLIALTFIYGKMMKKVMGVKQGFADEGVRKYKEQQNNEQNNAEKGGVQ